MACWSPPCWRTGWVQNRDRITLGDPNGGRFGVGDRQSRGHHPLADPRQREESGRRRYRIERAHAGLQAQAHA